MLAGKLLQGLERFLTRETADYGLLLIDISDQQAPRLLNALQKMPEVRHVQKKESGKNTLEVGVSLDRKQEVSFKRDIAAKLTDLGLGRFEIAAGDEATTYVRRVDTPPRLGPGYRKSWAVVISINEYQKWPKLEYAVNDAKAMARLLKQRGFDEVITILDGEATKERIIRDDEIIAHRSRAR